MGVASTVSLAWDSLPPTRASCEHGAVANSVANDDDGDDDDDDDDKYVAWCLLGDFERASPPPIYSLAAIVR